MRTDELLQKLRRAGEKGLTAKQIANIFGMKLRGSSNKIINQLRKEGHEIVQEEKNSPYVLKESKNKKIEEFNEDDVDTLVDELVEDEAEEKETLPKKEQIFKLLQENINKGVSKEKIASYANISEKTVSYHIHTLRANSGYNIICSNGYYILKSKKKYNRTQKKEFKPEKEQPSEEQKIEEALNDKELFLGIQLINQDYRQNYIDLLYKIIFYRKCAKALLDTNKILNGTGDGF